MALVNQWTNLSVRIQWMPDLEFADAFNKLRVEFVLYRFLHQQAARRRAAFAVQTVNHEDDSIQRAIEISIFEDDDRVFATEFEVHAL